MAAARSRWFQSLPQDELLPMEHALRKAILKAASSMGGKPFPLIEWIDRRIGGEIETVQNEKGVFEIQERGAATSNNGGAARGGGGPREVEAFFATLSPDSFAPPEEALRE